jgi:hypothetical protein
MRERGGWEDHVDLEDWVFGRSTVRERNRLEAIVLAKLLACQPKVNSEVT